MQTRQPAYRRSISLSPTGAEQFRLLDLAVASQLGRLVVWNNMTLDGSPNPWTEH